MATILQEPYILNDFTGGVIDDIAVAGGLLPRNAVRKGINVVFDRPRGSISQRLGTTQLGNTVSASNTINGLYNFRSSTAAKNQLLAAAITKVFYLNSGTWTDSLTGLTTGLKTRFFTYLDTVVVLNGTDAVKSSTDPGAASWVSTGGNLDVGNFPITKFATILNTRVLAAGNSTNPDTVYESSLEASNAVSWTSGNRSLKVFPNDGNGNITSLTGNGRLALIFKERATYRYDGDQLQRIANIGTTSHESVISDDSGITHFFGTGSGGIGFYRTSGAYPTKISRAITRYVEAIDPAFYQHINAFTDGNKIYWNVGSITIDNTTYTNARLVFSIADESWSVDNLADRFRVCAQYVTSTGAVTNVGGDTDGMVQTINSGTTDNGTAISSECETGMLVFTTRGRVKTVKEIVALAKHYQGLTVLIKVDDGAFKKIMSISGPETKTTDMPIMRGKRFFLKITASNSGTAFEFEGFEIPNIIDEGYSYGKQR